MDIATEGTRQRAIAAYQAGEGTQDQIADMYRITPRTFSRWWRRFQQHGTAAPGGRGHRQAAYVGDDLLALDREVAAHPDATLEQLRERTGKDCSLEAVRQALLRLDWHYKKNRYERVSRIGPT